MSGCHVIPFIITGYLHAAGICYSRHTRSALCFLMSDCCVIPFIMTGYLHAAGICYSHYTRSALCFLTSDCYVRLHQMLLWSLRLTLKTSMHMQRSIMTIHTEHKEYFDTDSCTAMTVARHTSCDSLWCNVLHCMIWLQCLHSDAVVCYNLLLRGFFCSRYACYIAMTLFNVTSCLAELCYILQSHILSCWNAHCPLWLQENLCWIIPHVLPTSQLVKDLNWTELNCPALCPSLRRCAM